MNKVWCWSCRCMHDEKRKNCASRYRTLWITIDLTEGSKIQRSVNALPEGSRAPRIGNNLSVRPRKKSNTLARAKADAGVLQFTMSTDKNKVSYADAYKMLLEAVTEELEAERDTLNTQLERIRKGEVE